MGAAERAAERERRQEMSESCGATRSGWHVCGQLFDHPGDHACRLCTETWEQAAPKCDLRGHMEKGCCPVHGPGTRPQFLGYEWAAKAPRGWSRAMARAVQVKRTLRTLWLYLELPAMLWPLLFSRKTSAACVRIAFLKKSREHFLQAYRGTK